MKKTMRNYRKYINALRQCAEEHENDKTQTAHIIVSDLCKDAADLLNALEQEPTLEDVRIKIEKRKNYIQNDHSYGMYGNHMADGMDETLEILDKYETSFKPWGKTVERLLKK